MNSDDAYFGADESCVLQYFKNFPENFITETEVCRRADGRERFMHDSHWAHNALCLLVEAGLIETDGGGKYRLKSKPTTGDAKQPKKFIAPQMREILERSNHNIDLSRFT